MYRRTLEKVLSDYDIIGYSEWISCLRKIETRHPNFLILDYYLGERSGLDIFREVHVRFPEIMVIILSGNKDGSIVLELMRAGIDNYVVKDEHAYETIREIIEQPNDSR